MIVGLYAETRADLDAMHISPEGQAAIANVPKFAAGGLSVWVLGHFEFSLDRSEARFHKGVFVAVARAAHALPHRSTPRDRRDRRPLASSDTLGSLPSGPAARPATRPVDYDSGSNPNTRSS
jgi:hypothetical protein